MKMKRLYYNRLKQKKFERKSLKEDEDWKMKEENGDLGEWKTENSVKKHVSFKTLKPNLFSGSPGTR